MVIPIIVRLVINVFPLWRYVSTLFVLGIAPIATTSQAGTIPSFADEHSLFWGLFCALVYDTLSATTDPPVCVLCSYWSIATFACLIMPQMAYNSRN